MSTSELKFFMEEKSVYCVYESFLVLGRVSDFVVLIVVCLHGVS